MVSGSAKNQSNDSPSLDELKVWLRCDEPSQLEELWLAADRLRREWVGDAVHFRGLVELSSYCRRNCLYCGIRAAHQLVRYRMTKEEVLESARMARDFGYGTLVIQTGEDPGVTKDFISDTIKAVKDQFGLAVTLSLGERTEEEWVAWKQAGADRYLLRFETSNPRLFRIIHPGMAGAKTSDELPRIAMLRTLRQIGYEIGSGVMVGIPGQSIDDLAGDIDLFRKLDLDMIGCGPYLPHPATPLGRIAAGDDEAMRQFDFVPACEQVENSNSMAFKVVALTRLVCPSANIPSTTAVATIDGHTGRIKGLSRGANVIMPNLTPTQYRMLYEIYPNKAATFETATQTHDMAVLQVKSIGRFPASGPGGRQREPITSPVPPITE